MMNLNKICPACGAEYYPHIVKCADCNVALLTHEEHKNAQEERKRTEAKAVENAVAVREGDLNWMSELKSVLLDSGIPCMLHSDAGCRKGCCGDTWRLKVSPEDLERAQGSIDEYLMELDPEFRTAKELIGEGKCPACGTSVGTDARDCPDCGLPLLIVEDD
jgi:peptidyl-tRNA hydrolase